MTFLGWLSDPFKGLSDLQLGDEKVTLNHLVYTTLTTAPFVGGDVQNVVAVVCFECFNKLLEKSYEL